MTAGFNRTFNAARQAQGFRDQAHLDLFYAALDHARDCPACHARDGATLTDDGWQPTSGRCEEGRRLDALCSAVTWAHYWAQVNAASAPASNPHDSV